MKKGKDNPTPLEGLADFLRNQARVFISQGLSDQPLPRWASEVESLQRAQLIGYSLSGYSDLSYVDEAAWERAVCERGTK